MLLSSCENHFPQQSYVDNLDQYVTLDSSTLNDLPIKYTIKAPKLFEIPIIGAYVDKRIIAGFRYRIRTIRDSKWLFGGQAMCLRSIGRGFAKRLTFLPKSNVNYFWTDSDNLGYFFESQMISVSDQFTIFDQNDSVLGTLVIKNILEPEFEINSTITNETIQKQIFCDFEADCNLFDSNNNDETKTMTIRCKAIANCSRVSNRFEIAKIDRLTNVSFDNQTKDIYLKCGIKKCNF